MLEVDLASVDSLIKAKKEGRLLVLPVPIGHRIYMVVSKSKAMFDHTTENWFAYVKKTSLKKSNLLKCVEEYGKTVFTSEHEARMVVDELNKEALAGAYRNESLIEMRKTRR